MTEEIGISCRCKQQADSAVVFTPRDQLKCSACLILLSVEEGTGVCEGFLRCCYGSFQQPNTDLSAPQSCHHQL